MEYLNSGAAGEPVRSFENTCDEQDFAVPATDGAESRLTKLASSPFRSLGGYLNYEGWSDRGRFMELDEALRRRGRDRRSVHRTANWAGRERAMQGRALSR
jgi:hypothetical protein